MKEGVPGLHPTIWQSLLVAAELGFVEEREAASCFFCFVMGWSALAIDTSNLHHYFVS
jgi:hypothetical protein